ncbi:MAG: rhodanese-like domain-containing protein [Gemmatimonadota bacterium]|jgi:rhodanese-related sulfurtransferase
MPAGSSIISRSDLEKLIRDQQDFHLVEVLSPESFQEEHLPEAINIPGDSLRARAPDVIPDRDATVVVYCASPSCTASDRAAKLLTEMGYTDVRDYRGGKEHWKEGGLPTESGEPAVASA